MSLEILKKRVGLGSHQGEMTLLRKIIRTVRRLLNRFFGTGPYQISTFANIATEVPEGPVQLSDVPSKAILSSECGETFTLFEVESTKPIICEEPKRELYYARDCAVLGFKGALYDPSTRTAFSETLEDWYEPIEYHTALTQSPSELTPLSGLTLHAAVLGGGNFYHFFMEALPKLFFAGKWLSEIDHLLIDKPCHPNQLAWLEPLSLSCEVHELTANTNFLCEHVLFTSRLVNHVEPNPWVVQSLREAFLPLAQKRELPSRIVVASRKNAATRSDHGISQLVDALPEAELIAFDELSPADIVTLCQQIKVFIGCHGAAFANTVFLPRDAIVVEICQTDHYPYYVRLSQVMGLKHYQIRLQNDHWSEVIDKVVKLLVC